MASFNINEYEPVEVRLARFWETYPNGTIQTELVFHDETRFIVKSAVFANREATFESLIATGYAEERVDNNPKRVNFASALENCETSAIGRALANANFAPKGSRPSREEMAKVNRATQVVESPAVVKLRDALASYSSNAEVRKSIVTSVVTRPIASLNDLTDAEISDVHNALNQRIEGEAPFTIKEEEQS